MHSGDREGHRRYTLPRCPAFYAGAFYSCGVAADTEAYCWGDNDDGTLGVVAFGGTSTKPKAVVGP